MISFFVSQSSMYNLKYLRAVLIFVSPCKEFCILLFLPGFVHAQATATLQLL